ncbi:MAG: phosphate--acyl-ACP acyltransferase, partial [Cytophagaceae bacterium]
MKIAVDAMGGDFAPDAIVEGVLMAAAELPEDVTIVLIGRQAIVQELIQKHKPHPIANIELVNADDVIEMSEHPTKALSQKPNS